MCKERQKGMSVSDRISQNQIRHTAKLETNTGCPFGQPSAFLSPFRFLTKLLSCLKCFCKDTRVI